MASATRQSDPTKLAPRQGRIPRLEVAAVALAVAVLLHILDSALRGSPPSPAPELSQPGHVGTLVLTVVAIAGLLLGRRWGRFLITAAAGTVVAGAVLYHALPASVPFANSYWDGGDLVNWSVVVAAAGAALWCLATVVRTDALGLRPDRADASGGR